MTTLHRDELIDEALLERFQDEYVTTGRISAGLFARLYVALLAHRDGEATP